jgi:hypothetical protein
VLRAGADGLADADLPEAWFLSVREFVLEEGEVGFVAGEFTAGEFATGGFRSAEFLGEVGAPFAFDFAARAEFADVDGFVLAGAEEFSVTGEAALELLALGAEDLEERSSRRGTKMMARRMAAAVLTRKSLLERGCGLEEMTRRGLPMVALT